MSTQDSLLFIDTNIFLDFYRATGNADFKLLGRLRQIKNKIISTYQIEIEFQKNRQKRMLESFNKLKLAPRPEIPGLFVGTDQLKELNAAFEQVEKSLKGLRESLSAGMRHPVQHDSVYRAAQEIFSLQSDFNLTQTKPEYSLMRRRARQRFLLGCPPRKDRDTSIGDAINWEWIVECATKSRRSIIIVSRDDYGLQFTGESYLNEWLRQEFSERVEGKSRVTLTESLASALKQIKVPVTKAEEKAEEKLLETLTQEGSTFRSAVNEMLEPHARAYNITVDEMIDRVVRSNEEFQKSLQESLLASLGDERKERLERLSLIHKPQK